MNTAKDKGQSSVLCNLVEEEQANCRNYLLATPSAIKILSSHFVWCNKQAGEWSIVFFFGQVPRKYSISFRFIYF